MEGESAYGRGVHPCAVIVQAALFVIPPARESVRVDIATHVIPAKAPNPE